MTNMIRLGNAGIRALAYPSSTPGPTFPTFRHRFAIPVRGQRINVSPSPWLAIPRRGYVVWGGFGMQHYCIREIYMHLASGFHVRFSARTETICHAGHSHPARPHRRDTWTTPMAECVCVFGPAVMHITRRELFISQRTYEIANRSASACSPGVMVADVETLSRDRIVNSNFVYPEQFHPPIHRALDPPI